MPQYLVAGYLPDDFDPSQTEGAMGREIHALNECADLDEAVAWARKGVAATRGQVEVERSFSIRQPTKVLEAERGVLK